MTAIVSVSRDNLKSRRQSLRSQRRWKAWQATWRFLAIGGMAGGLFWLMTMPRWIIKTDSQIEIEGNHLLSQDQIQHFLSLSYPQSLWQLSSQTIINQLKTQAPIEDAKVARQNFPPKLIVSVRERQPIAIALSTSQEKGFLDAQGVFIPRQIYPQGVKALDSLPLKVIGFDSTYRPAWRELYPLIRQSAVKITAIDWRDPNNLVLKTELGTVYLGSHTARFPEQVKVLAQMRRLSSRVPVSRIIYIDLTNPAAPTVQLKQPSPQKPKAKAISSLVMNR
jgi:cell division protein FtsQ